MARSGAPYGTHGHHVVHPMREWTLRPEATKIRQTPSLIVDMGHELHNRLHRGSSPIPLLGYHALQVVSREFEPTDDPLETIDALQDAIENAARHPRAYQVERGVARLAIDAIEMQRPFIQEALAVPELPELALFTVEEIS